MTSPQNFLAYAMEKQISDPMHFAFWAQEFMYDSSPERALAAYQDVRKRIQCTSEI